MLIGLGLLVVSSGLMIIASWHSSRRQWVSCPGCARAGRALRPPAPGFELELELRDLLSWTTADHLESIDPVVAAGMAHYRFETCTRSTTAADASVRLLVVLHLLYADVLPEPTLTVSPWWEARRADYYDGLLQVSTVGDWDSWIRFFADGLTASAGAAERQLTDLLAVSHELKQRVCLGGLRAENAVLLVDFCLQQPIFTVRQVQRQLQVTYPRANGWWDS